MVLGLCWRSDEGEMCWQFAVNTGFGSVAPQVSVVTSHSFLAVLIG